MTQDPDALVPVAPVTPVAFHIMLALATGERHGYASWTRPRSTQARSTG